MSRYPCRILAAITLAAPAFTGACQAWHVEHAPPTAVVQRQNYGPVAVTMNDLRWVVLTSPRIVNDSIVGIRTGGNTFGKGRTALPLSGVRAIETRRFSFLRTLYLGAFAAAVPTLYKLATKD